MTRRPFTSVELGEEDPALDALAGELEQLDPASQPSPGFHERVLAAVAAEPPHRRSWLRTLMAPPGSGVHGGAVRSAVLAVVAVAGITAAVLAGDLLDQVRQRPGTSPSLVPPSSMRTGTLSPSPSPTASPTPSATASRQPSASALEPTADPSDEDASHAETPEPSASESSGSGTVQPSETPSPSESDDAEPED